MANEIDNRVVQMQFDNAQFERGVSTSLGTLDKLKSALKLNGAADGFNNIQNASNRLDFSGLIAGVQQAGQKFSVLEIAAITAIQNITNRAVNAGISLAKSLSVDQLTAGWAKYGDKAQSVNTIMAATGLSVEEVGEQLDKLNSYTDETSANFTDMTSNIGKFTNAGIKLDDAAQAMQGITNWAYLSGASVSEAGRAMYNLSQAMAVGAVKLIDWKSIENANMATQKFKQTAIDTAVAMGTLKDKGDGVYKTLNGTEVTVTNFNDGLHDLWFSSDVLSGTLDKFGSFSTDIIALSDETGITVVDLMRHFKEFENGTADFGKIAENSGKSADEMRNAFQMMGSASSSIAKRLFITNNKVKKNFEARAAMIKNATGEEVDAQKLLTEYLEESYLKWEQSGKKIIEDNIGIGESLADIFSEMESNQELGVAAFRAAQEYRSLRDAIDATKDAVSTGWMKSFELLFGNAEEAKRVWGAVGDTLYEVFAAGGEERNKLLQGWKDNGGYESFVRAIENVSEAIIGLKELVDEVFEDSFLNIDSEDVDLLVEATKKLEEFSKIVKAITTGDISGVFDPTGMAELPKVAKDLEGVDLSEIVGDVDEYNNKIKIAERGSEILTSAIEGFASAFDIVKSIVEGIGIALSPIFELIGSVGSDVLDLIEAIAKRLGVINETNLEDGKVLSFFEKLKTTIGPIVEWLSGVIHSFMETITNIIDPDKEGGLSDFGETFGKIFEGIGKVFGKFFPILSSIGDAIGTVITTIVDKLAEFADNATVQDFLDLLKNGFNIGILAGIFGFATNLKNVSGDVSEATSGILNIFRGEGGPKPKTNFLTTLGETISDFADKISESMKKVVDVEAIKAFATAVLMLAGALFLLSLTDAESAAASLAILTVGVGELLAAMKLFTDSAVSPLALIAAGVGFAAMSAGVILLAGALILLSLVPSDTLATTIMNLTFAIGVMVGALSALSLIEPGRLLAAAAAMLIMSPALLALAISIGIMALIPAEKAATGIMLMLFALGEMVGVLAALSLIGPMCLVAAAALLVLSPALIIMAAALAILAAIPAQEAANAVMALLFVLIEAAGVLAAVSLLGPMCLVAAAALLILSPALLLMAAALFAISKIPMQALGTAIVGLALTFAVIAGAAWAVAPVVGPLLAFAGALLAISASVVILGAGLILVAAGIMLLIGASGMLVDTVIGAFDNLIETALNLLDSFFDLGVKIINKVIEGLKSLLADLGPVAKDILDGLVQGITNGLSSIWEAGKSLGSSLLNGVKNFLGIESPSKAFMEVGDYSILGLLESVDDGMGAVAEAGKTIGETLIDSTEDALSDYDSIMDGHELKPVLDMSNLAPDSDSVGIQSLSAARSAFGSIPGATEANNQNVRTYSPVFNIYQQPNQSPEDLAAIINRELGRLYVT